MSRKRHKDPNKRIPIEQGVRTKVYQRDGFRCLLCKTNKDLTLDHIRPLPRGGTNDFDNLQTLCVNCNQEKGCRNKYQLDYRENKTGRALAALKHLEHDKTNKRKYHKFYK